MNANANTMNSIKSTYEKWLENVTPSEHDTLQSIPATELEDSFYQDLAFGTGGLRGKLGIGPNRMNSYTVGKATQGLANYLNAHFENPTVALCRDTRHGSEEFVRKAASVLAANGIRSYLYERVEPTPTLSFAVRELDCSAGINITASHNPAAYNGYKVYGPDGCQITINAAKSIQAAIDAVDLFDSVREMPFDKALSENLIRWTPQSVIDNYIEKTLAQSTGEDCSALKVVYTPLHGVGEECVTRTLKEISVGELHVVSEQAVKDGDFPTCPYPNPEIREALELGLQYCEQLSPDLLLATDPDADRVGIAVSHAGDYELLSGNEVGLLLLDFLAERAETAGSSLSKKIAVTTVVSAPMADDLAVAHGFELRRTLTGFKFIGEQIGLLEAENRTGDFLLGFEESYGYLAGTHVRDKDAVVASMLICELAAHWKARGLDLYEAMAALYERHGFWASALLSQAYEGPEGATKMATVMTSLRQHTPKSIGDIAVVTSTDYTSEVAMPVVSPGSESVQTLPAANVVEFQLAEGSRVIFRPSGTEPKAKAYVFARATTGSDASEKLVMLKAEAQSILKGDK